MTNATLRIPGFDPCDPASPRIGITGDVVIGPAAEDAMAAGKADPWTAVHDWCGAQDLLIVTLDTTMPGDDPKPWKPLVYSGPQTLQTLPRGKATLFNLATNHAFDTGREAFVKFRDALRASGGACVGAGLDREDAETPWRGEVGGVPLTVFAAVHHGCHPRPALDGGADVARLDSETWRQAVKRECAASRFVVTLLHGGIQGCHLPSPRAVEITRDLARLGVHSVVWSHAHVIQGATRVDGSLTAYGLGDVFFPRLIGDPVEPQDNIEYDRGLLLSFVPSMPRVSNAEVMLVERSGLAIRPRTATPTLQGWFERISNRPTGARYALWWKGFRLWEDVVVGTFRYLRRGSVLRQLRKLRPHHVGLFLRRMGNARGDARDV